MFPGPYNWHWTSRPGGGPADARNDCSVDRACDETWPPRAIVVSRWKCSRVGGMITNLSFVAPMKIALLTKQNEAIMEGKGDFVLH